MRPAGTQSRPGASSMGRPAEADPAAGESRRPQSPFERDPKLIGYAMGPAALPILLVLRQFGLVARVPVWLYVVVFVAIPLTSYLTDALAETRTGGAYVHLRVATHVAATTTVIYMSGWGPELVCAYAFVLVDNVARSRSRAWRIVSAWTVAGVVVGQLLTSFRWAPTFLPVARANVLALLGIVVVLFVAKMLGTTTGQKEMAENDLRYNEERFRSLVQHSYDTMVVTSKDGVITFASPAVESLIGLTPDEIVGKTWLSFVHPDERDRISEQILARLSARGVTAEPIQFKMAHSDGTWRHVEAVVSDLRDRPAVDGYVTNLRDVTERKQAQEALEHQAMHDPLTGLPNRALLADRIEQAILRGRRRDSTGPVVMFLDLDRFKLVNDSLGHSAGDKVLVEVADRLRMVMRAADTLARFGGDEFVVLCEQIADRESLLAVAERFLGALEPPFYVDGKRFQVGASIGAALIGGDDVTADELLGDADTAMYLAKTKSGRSRIQIFDHATRAMARDRVHTEEELANALRHDELVIHYQPIVDLWTRRRVGVEALVRWQHPRRGLLAPAAFMDVAEQTGLVVPLGSWVLRSSCAQVRDWNDQLSADHQLALSVNMSARQLTEPDLVEEVSSVLVEAGISPRTLRLVLELTEGLMPVEEDGARTHVRQLHRMGVVLAIDDFGTGYSSLQYMRDLPIGVVKIDRTFIAAIGRSSRDEAIIRSVVDLAHTLGLTVTAEGVETEAQLEFMCEVGCDMAQGFLFGAPEAPEAFDIHCRSIHAAIA